MDAAHGAIRSQVVCLGVSLVDLPALRQTSHFAAWGLSRLARRSVTPDGEHGSMTRPPTLGPTGAWHLGPTYMRSPGVGLDGALSPGVKAPSMCG